MDLNADPRLMTDTRTEEVCDEHGEGDLVVAHLQISRTTWDEALATAADALTLLEWLESNRMR